MEFRYWIESVESDLRQAIVTSFPDPLHNSEDIIMQTTLDRVDTDTKLKLKDLAERERNQEAVNILQSPGSGITVFDFFKIISGLHK